MIERAVYSLWTTPMEGQHVGFNTEEALINCFKLSLHYTKQWFKEVHLVTDVKGKELVEKHGLKFDNINTDLEEVMKGVYKNHWSLGKIYACKIQDKPFMHIDIDVILFKPLPESFLKAEAGFQNYEGENYSFIYLNLIQHCKENIDKVPKWFIPKFSAYNCGLISFNKLDILKEWWESSLNHVKLLDDTKYTFTKTDAPPSLLYEQVFIYYLCKHYKYNVKTLLDYGDANERKLDHIPETLAKRLGYTHLMAASKRLPEVEKKVKARLAKEKISI